MTFQLSDRAKELIPKSRIVSFAALANQEWSGAPVARLQAADDGGRYLTDEDVAFLAAEVPGLSAGQGGADLSAACSLRDNAENIVTIARQQVLLRYPGIAEPGGDLYPAIRAEACWRDFWHFLRCITYGIASGSQDFTSAEGLHYMNLLYQEMQVPLLAMVTGLEALKVESLKQLPDQAEAISPYFDHLIAKMRGFK